MKLILEHNRLDLLTMLEVLPFLDGPPVGCAKGE